MRNQWYGDKRDIVKWGALVSLAHEHKASAIFQVAMMPEDKPPDMPLEFCCSKHNEEKPIPKEVWSHFRNIHDITRLQNDIKIEIIVFRRYFQQKERGVYFKEVCETIAAHTSGKWIVFLDPDTGIESKKAKIEHVAKNEIASVYKALKAEDMLVLYQHARRCATWIEDTRKEFIKAIGDDNINEDTITTITSNHSSDVAFFMVVKEGV